MTKCRKRLIKYNSRIFSEIYLKNMWGGMKNYYYSGTGSYHHLINDYADLITKFIVENSLNNIIEIGCGDFTVTSRIIKRLRERNFSFHYTGYDVVKDLILRNKKIYADEEINFFFKDACSGKIKNGDILIVRQVLQHLDNRSIQQILKKFRDYKFVVVTEHQLLATQEIDIIPNLDKNTSSDIRLGNNSSVYLDEEPFNLKNIKLLHEMAENFLGKKASINTYLIETIPT